MLEFFKQLLNNGNVVMIIGFITTIIVSFITAYLTSKNSKKQLTSEFYKKEGIKIQEKILDFWSSLLIFDFDYAMSKYKVETKLVSNTEDVIVIKNILRDSYIYSSKATIKAISRYQQYIFKNKDIPYKEKRNSVFESMNILIISARIIKRMKYDFTGEKVDELELLKMKLNDFDFKKRFVSRILIIYYNLIENIIFILSLILITILILFLF